MLQLAPAAFGKVTAWRQLMMRAGRERAIVEQCISGHAPRHMASARRDPVAPRGDADDQLVHKAMARATAAARSSAIICGPAISAARPCSHTAAQLASNGSSPLARIAAVMPARDRKSTRLNSQSRFDLVCRLLLEKKKL